MPSRPFSGRFSEGRPSHFGPPTAPRITLSEARQASIVSCGSGVPVASIAAPPMSTSSYTNSWPNLSPTLSRHFSASSTISGPIPSPFITAILNFMIVSFFVRLPVERRGRIAGRIVVLMAASEAKPSARASSVRPACVPPLAGRIAGFRSAFPRKGAVGVPRAVPHEPNAPVGRSSELRTV